MGVCEVDAGMEHEVNTWDRESDGCRKRGGRIKKQLHWKQSSSGWWEFGKKTKIKKWKTGWSGRGEEKEENEV